MHSAVNLLILTEHIFAAIKRKRNLEPKRVKSRYRESQSLMLLLLSALLPAHKPARSFSVIRVRSQNPVSGLSFIPVGFDRTTVSGLTPGARLVATGARGIKSQNLSQLEKPGTRLVRLWR
jgi:hypothetical protein